MKGYKAFESWADVLTHVQSGQTVYYHAPMDLHPSAVQAVVKGGNIRVFPLSKSADPFTADNGHLDRFRRYGDV